MHMFLCSLSNHDKKINLFEIKDFFDLIESEGRPRSQDRLVDHFSFIPCWTGYEMIPLRYWLRKSFAVLSHLIQINSGLDFLA